MLQPFSWFSLVVLASAPWPLVSFVSIPSIRRAYPRLAIAGVAILASYLLFIIGTAVILPELLPLMAIVAGCLLVGERWRARPGFGSKRGLPPGSLSLVPRVPWVDEKFYAKQADTHGPVFKMSQFFRPMVCLMGAQEGVELFRRHADQLTSPAVRFSSFIPKEYIRYMSPADHSYYKPVFRAAFNRKVLQDCAMDFRAMDAEELERMAMASQASPNGVHPACFVEDLTFRCMLRLFIGVRYDSPDYRRLRSLYTEVQIGKASSTWRPKDRKAAHAIAAIIGERLEGGGSSLPSCFLKEILGNDAIMARDQTVLLNLTYMIRIASSDLAGFLTWAIKLLVDNPEWIERLREKVLSGENRDEGEALAALIVKEVLRMERSEFIFRKAQVDICYKEFTIPRNWIVRVCIRDGHRDADTFPNPDAFDPERFKSRSYDKKEYSPLGIGRHACLGGQVIDALGKVFLIELTGDYDVSVVSDGCREYGRSHWEPSSAFRIILTRRVKDSVQKSPSG